MIPLQHGAEMREQKELGHLFPQLFVLIVAEMNSIGGRRDGGGEGARKERVMVRLWDNGWLVC